MGTRTVASPSSSAQSGRMPLPTVSTPACSGGYRDLPKHKHLPPTQYQPHPSRSCQPSPRTQENIKTHPGTTNAFLTPSSLTTNTSHPPSSNPLTPCSLSITLLTLFTAG